MRKHVRNTAAAAAIAAALALTGCSSESKDNVEGDKGKETGAGAPSAGGDEGAVADVTGSWIATTDGKIVALIVQGSDAAVAGEHVCSGKVAKADEVTLELKCADGNADRTTGLVTPGADGSTITVKWGSGIEDTFQKSSGEKLPEGIPTDFPKLPAS